MTTTVPPLRGAVARCSVTPSASSVKPLCWTPSTVTRATRTEGWRSVKTVVVPSPVKTSLIEPPVGVIAGWTWTMTFEPGPLVSRTV